MPNQKSFTFVLLASIIMLALTVQVEAIFALTDQSAPIQALDVESRVQQARNDAQTELVARIVVNDILLSATGTEVEVQLDDVPSDAVVTGVELKMAGADGEAIEATISAPDSSPVSLSSPQIAEGETTHALDGSAADGAWTIKLMPQEATASEGTAKLILLVHYQTAHAKLPQLKDADASSIFLRLPAPVSELGTPLSEAEGGAAQASNAPAVPENWEVIESQDFEGTSFPGWYTIHDNADGYERNWCATDYLSYSGYQSAWPACGGADGVDPWYYDYPNNMDSWLVYGPFDLSDAYEAEVGFSLWRMIEADYDYMAFGVSTDGMEFWGNAWDGEAPWWEEFWFSLDDYAGESQVWVAWHFYSDDSVTYEGPFVDDVLISKYGSPSASATPYPTSTRTPYPTSTRTPYPTSTRTPYPTSTRTPYPTSTPNHPTYTPTSTPNHPTYTPTSTPPSGYPPSESIHLELWSGYTSINLEWMLDGSLAGDLYHYHLLRKADGGNFSLIETTTHSQYVDQDANLTAGVEYCYQVKALNSASQVIGTSNIECTTIGHLTLWVPDEVAPPDATDVPVMINLANGNGLCIGAMNITIDYDQTIAVPTGDVSRTVYTQAYAFIANTTTPGVVKIVSITGSNQCIDLYGAGTLFNVFFDVIGQQGEVSPLDFIEGLTGTVIYDQDNLFTPVELALQNGSLTVAFDYIRGDINGDGAVNAADAALALLIASGTYTPTAKQLAACDVNGDGACNSADSTLILCYAGFQNWELCGGSESATRFPERAPQDGTVDLAIGEPVREGQSMRYPVEITNAPELAGGEFVFAYDAVQMMPTGVSLSSLTNDFKVESNTSLPGMMHVSIASLEPTGGDGTILELEFRSLTGGTSSLDFGAVRLYDANGRDFYTSALDRHIELNSVDGNPRHMLYLPAITR